LFIGFVLGEIGFESFCKFAPRQHDAPSAAFTFQANIGAQARDDPFIRAAGMLFSKTELIVQLKVGEHDGIQ
jgi:hypothetical protein